MRSNRRVSPGAFAFIELMIVAAIMGMVYYVILKAYLKNPPVDKETAQALKEQKIDTSTYKTTVSSVKEKLAAIEEQHAKELEQIGQ